MSTTMAPALPQATGFDLRRALRRASCVASVLIGAMCFWQIYKAVQNSRDLENAEFIDTIHYTEPVKFGAAQKLEGAKMLVQAGLLVVAVLWGLLIAKRDEKILEYKDYPEVTMFAIANLLFIGAAYCYAMYSDRMAMVLALGAEHYDEPKNLTILNYRNPLINDLYDRLVYAWEGAVVVTGLTLLSAHMFKPHAPKENAPCESPPAPLSAL